MTKKQRNRKLVSQNNRNRLINRRYSSTVKTLSKLFLKQMKAILLKDQTEIIKKDLTDVFIIRNKLYQAIDKAVKKGVIHLNTASRKKMKVNFLYKTLQY